MMVRQNIQEENYTYIDSKEKKNNLGVKIVFLLRKSDESFYLRKTPKR